MHRRLPSFSLTGASGEKGTTEEERSNSRDRSGSKESRGRSRSPFRLIGQSKRNQSTEGLRRDVGDEEESDGEESASGVRPSNNFDSDSDESETDTEDEQLERNTEANALGKARADHISTESYFRGEGPNLVNAEFPPPTPTSRNLRRRASTKTKYTIPLALVPGRPIFEKNRCTISLTLGDPDLMKQGRRTRSYLVASDLSLESRYALEWSIGTVLRDGDDCLIVSVMETDSKIDADESTASAADKKAKLVNQRERQASALILLRQATALLERTRLNVRIQCQAVHAKNTRHMLVDMIDYLEPTMVIIGTRGLSKIKGMLLGSVSNYLIQKSSSPVMVTRRPLRLARTVHKKLSSLNREARMTISHAQIDKSSHGGEILDDKDEPKDVAEKIQAMKISEKE